MYNTKLDDTDTRAIILDELVRYKHLGGGTIVENTVEGISRNLGLMKELSVKSGVKIIAGTGMLLQKNIFYWNTYEHLYICMLFRANNFFF